MDDASIVFEAMAESSVVSWTEMILGFVENGNESIALDLHSRMQREGLVPDSIAFVAAIKACSRLAANDGSIDDALRRGRTVHRQAARNALETNVFVANSLIDLYSKCRKLDLARQIFEGTSSIDLVTWNSIILGHAEGGEAEIALELFETMRIEAIKACVCLSQIEAGTLIDAKIVKSTSLSRIKTIHSLADQPRTDRLHHFVANSLVHAYSRCGSMIDAARVFASIRRKDPLSWSEIILGYAESGEAKTALDLYARMKQEHCPMNHVTILAAIKACSSAAERGGIEITSWCLDQGRNIHRDAIDSGNDRQIFVASALIDMYAKCGSLADASSVFDAMDHRNTVAWNALILGNVESDRANAALELFVRMKREGFDPDAITYVAVLRACSRLGDLETGIEIEQELRAAGIIDKDTSVCNSLVDFYGKCGSMIDARRVFDSIGDERRDVVSWNALIDGYSRQGDTERAFYAFEMLCSGESSIKPDGVSFLAVLVLCSHAGLVDRAKSYFQAMVLEHGIVPERRHLVCLVDLLGRADRLDEAVAVAKMVGGDAGDVVWTSILGSSRKWKNARVGKIAFRAMKELESSPSAYVLMSDLCKPQTKHHG